MLPRPIQLFKLRLAASLALSILPGIGLAEDVTQDSDGARESGAESRYRLILLRSEAVRGIDFDQLLLVLQGQLGELGVDVVVSDATEPTKGGLGSARTENSAGSVLGLVWLEPTDTALVVHFYEPAGSQMRDRRIPLTRNDVTNVEEVAIVVRSAAAALVEGLDWEEKNSRAPAKPSAAQSSDAERPLDGSPTKANRPQSPDEMHDVSPSSKARASLRAEVGYDPSWLGPPLAVQHGIGAALRFRFPQFPLVIAVAYTWLPKLKGNELSVEFELRRFPVELQLGYESKRAGRFRWGASTGLVVEPIVRSTRVSMNQWTSRATTRRVLLSVPFRIRVQMRLVPRLDFFTETGVEVALNPYRGILVGAGEDGTQTANLWTVSVVRPQILLGLSVSFL